MFNFLHGNSLSEEIKSIMRQRPFRCAVAFWGYNTLDILNEVGNFTGVEIICNLFSGSVDTRLISHLKEKGASVYMHNTLHAKVYLGLEMAIITSANASTNGLGFAGNELRGWQEAGVLVPISDEINIWYNNIKRQSQPISDEDIENATMVASHRNKHKPPYPSFLNFPMNDPDDYLVCWTVDDTKNYNVNEAEIRKQLNMYNDDIKKEIQESIQTEDGSANNVLKNKWILWWTRNNNGSVRKSSLSWCRLTDRIISNAKYVDNKWMDVVLIDRDPGPSPFDADNENFFEAFKNTMAKKEFLILRQLEYSYPWFNEERVRATREFWKAVYSEYIKITSICIQSIPYTTKT